MCALVAAVFAYFIHPAHALHVATVVGTSLFIAILIAATVGALAPATCKKLGIDPTAASGPFVTVTIDIIGIAIYFTIAMLALGLIQ